MLSICEYIRHIRVHWFSQIFLNKLFCGTRDLHFKMEENQPSVEESQMATPVVVQPITIEQAQATTRRQKARNRRNVWKDQTGSSLFELDGAENVQLVCKEASKNLMHLQLTC